MIWVLSVDVSLTQEFKMMLFSHKKHFHSVSVPQLHNDIYVKLTKVSQQNTVHIRLDKAVKLSFISYEFNISVKTVKRPKHF